MQPCVTLLVWALVWALLALPAAAQPVQPSGALTPMTQADIRTLLSDVEAGPDCCDRSEAFYVDGTYVHLGIAADPGQYNVTGNRVCVTTEFEPAQACRRLHRDAGGTAFFVADNDGRTVAVDPRPAPDRSYWQSPPAVPPRLRLPPPPGYVIASQAGDTIEYVPASERNSGHWTSKITSVVVRDPAIGANDYLATTVKDPVTTWPGATRTLLSNAPENGYPSLSARLTFPGAFPDDVPQVDYIKLIDAPPVLYFVRYSFRGQPDAEREAAVSAWLKTVIATPLP